MGLDQNVEHKLKKAKKLLAVLIVAVMTAEIVPIAAFAVDPKLTINRDIINEDNPCMCILSA